MLIPTLFVRDIAEALAFCTGILDFRLATAFPEEAPFYAVLQRGEDELHLATAHGPRQYGQGCAIVVCEDADALWEGFRARGLQVPARPDSPVHAGPVDQSWGTREFYVDDPSGNTFVFQQR